MKTTVRMVMISELLCCMSLVLLHSEAYGLLEDISLVGAVVTEVGSEENGCIISKASIERVYYGSKELIGHALDLYTLTKGGNAINIVRPIPYMGQEGLWLVKHRQGELPIHVTRNVWGILWPSRKGVDSRYPQTLKLAQTIEQVFRIQDTVQRHDQLKEYAQHEIDEISVWAIYEIGDLKRAEDIAFLKDLLAQGVLSVRGQIAADETLANIENENGIEWQNTPQRLALLSEWVTKDPNEYDAENIWRRIDMIAQHPGPVDYRVILDLIRTVTSNPQVPLKIRRYYLVHSLRTVYTRSDIKQECFDFLLDRLSAQDREIALFSAEFIQYFVELDESQREKIRVAAQASTDQRVKKALATAMQKSIKSQVE